MAASVLNSPRATELSVYVVRAFVRLRDLLASNKVLAQKLEELEHKLKNHDDAIAAILSAIRQLMKYSPSGRAVRAACTRPASASQRRDAGSPSGLYASVATS
ncbi:MAG: hypothetical protein ABSG18_19215 [Steroidobacteraceae bacterium]|jgi:hypothetical protein